MEETNRLNRLYSYAFYSLALLVLIASGIANSGYALISAILLLLSAVYLNSGHIINNMLVKRSRVIIIRNGYKLGRNLSSAVIHNGDSYTGISIAEFIVNKPVDKSSFEPIINNIKDPFEFSISMREVDRIRLIESLETKKRVKEISLSRIEPKMYNKINQVKKELRLRGRHVAKCVLNGQ